MIVCVYAGDNAVCNRERTAVVGKRGKANGQERPVTFQAEGVRTGDADTAGLVAL
jgi:hypothetical protein